MAGNFRLTINNNKIPEITAILRSRSNKSKADIAEVATRAAEFYELKLKKAAPKSKFGSHELTKGLSVTPVRRTSTRWSIVPESKAFYTKFVIEGITGNNVGGTRIVPIRYKTGRDSGSGPKALTVFYGGHGAGAPFFYTKSVRPHKGNPFQVEPARQAFEYMDTKMKILGHNLTSIDFVR